MNISRNEKLTLIFLVIFLGILLFPILFYPEVSDLAIYYQGGQKLLNGKIYVDFIDVKSPLLFAIFSIVGLITGKSILLLRGFELLMHLGTSLLLYFIVKKYFTKFIAFASAIIYSISILLINFPGTFQAETISNIFIILLINLLFKIYSRKDTGKINLSFLYLGLLCGILSAMKISFLILPFSLVAIELFTKEFSIKRWKLYLTFLSSFIFSFFIAHFCLIDKAIFEGYMKTWEYTMFYSKIPSFDSAFLKFVIKDLANYFGYYNTFLLTTFGIIGVYFYLTFNRGNKVDKIDLTNDLKRFLIENENILSIVGILFFSLLFTVIYERKLFAYHFSRIFIPLVIFEAVGLYIIYTQIFKNFVNYNLIKRIIFSITLILLLILSPVPRLLQQWQFPLKKIKGNEEYYKFVDKTGNFNYCYFDKYKMSEYINKNFPNDTKILMASNGSFDILFHLNGNLINTFAQSTFYISSKKIDLYINRFIKDLNKTDLLIIQKTDNYYLLNKHNLSTNEWIFSNKIVNKKLQSDFIKVKDYPGLVLYQRK